MNKSTPPNPMNPGERERMLVPSRPTNGALSTSNLQSRGRPAPKPADSSGLSILSILAALRRRWAPAILLGCLLAPLLAAAGWFALAPKQSATAFLQVESSDMPLAFKTADQEAGGVIAFKIFKNSQKNLITDTTVLQTALTNLLKPTADGAVVNLPTIREAGTAVQQLQWLRESLKVTFLDDSEVMAVELSSSSVEESKLIVNAVVNAYLEEIVEKEMVNRRKRLAELNRAHEETSETILKERKLITGSVGVVGSADPETLSLAEQTAVQQYGQLQTELNMVKYELLKAKGLLELTNDMKVQATAANAEQLAEAGSKETETEIELGIQISQLEYEQALGKDLEYQELSAEGREVSRKIREMERASFGERMTGPLMQEAKQIRQALADRREVVMDMVKKDLEMRMASGRLKTSDIGVTGTNLVDPQLVAKQQLEVKILEERKSMIEEDLEKVKDTAKALGSENAELEMRRAKIASLNEVLANLQREIEATRIEQNSSRQRVFLRSPAEDVQGSDPKKRLAATAAGGVFGLMLPLLAFVFFDMQRKLIDDPKKLSSDLNVDILGMLPSVKGPAALLESPQSKRGKSQYANLVESVHSIVAMLVKKASVDERQIFMVSSAAPGEGKSTLAQNLWTGLCNANYRCLLVDLDLRRPSIHRYLNVEIGVGASDVLSGNATVEDAIRSIEGNKFFMTAGENRQLNLAALATDPLPKFFDHLRAHFDFIIVDSAPILPIVDSRIIGEHVDGAVLATIRDRSRVPQLIAAIELLKAHDTDILGVVMSGFGTSTYNYTYSQG